MVGHGCMQVYMVLEKDLRILYFILKARGSEQRHWGPWAYIKPKISPLHKHTSSNKAIPTPTKSHNLAVHSIWAYEDKHIQNTALLLLLFYHRSRSYPASGQYRLWFPSPFDGLKLNSSLVGHSNKFCFRVSPGYLSGYIDYWLKDLWLGWYPNSTTGNFIWLQRMTCLGCKFSITRGY